MKITLNCEDILELIRTSNSTCNCDVVELEIHEYDHKENLSDKLEPPKRKSTMIFISDEVCKISWGNTYQVKE